MILNTVTHNVVVLGKDSKQTFPPSGIVVRLHYSEEVVSMYNSVSVVKRNVNAIDTPLLPRETSGIIVPIQVASFILTSRMKDNVGMILTTAEYDAVNHYEGLSIYTVGNLVKNNDETYATNLVLN